MKKRFLAMLLAACVVLSFAGCGQDKSAGDKGGADAADANTAAQSDGSDSADSIPSDGIAVPQGWDDPYEETVTVTIGGLGNPQDLNLPEGDTLEDNEFTRLYKERWNIDVKVEWMAVDESALSQKISLAITSGDMPDIMMVPNQVLLSQLVESDMVADLDEAYENGMSDYNKAVLDTYGERKFQTCIYDGKLKAISNYVPGYSYAYTWLRKDWLDKLGLEEPETMEDMLEVAKLESATPLQTFFYIKIRYLSSSLLFVTIMSLISSFKIFREVYLLTRDYPYDSIYTLQHYMNNMFKRLDYQMLSAAAILMAIVMVVIIGILFIAENRFGKDVEG